MEVHGGERSRGEDVSRQYISMLHAWQAAAFTICERFCNTASRYLNAWVMVVNGARRVSSWHAMDNANMPRLDRGLQEVAYAPAPPAAPDRSGVCGVVSCPAPRSPVRLGWARRACGLRAGDALPVAGGTGGLHQPRPGEYTGTVKLTVRHRRRPLCTGSRIP